MHTSYTEIDLDKSVLVKMKVIFLNSLTLFFKFYDGNGDAINVAGIAFKFTVVDAEKTTEYLVVNNADWERENTNEIKYVVNSLNITPDTYKLDFTCTYEDGRVQTLMDGDFIVRDRYIKT